MRSRIRSRLGTAEAAVLEDLTQQALIQVLRLVRREGALRLSGLLAHVARITAIDEIRRRKRQRTRLSGWEANLDRIETLASPEADTDHEGGELLWFLLLEYLRVRRAPCHTLAMAFADHGDWKSAARTLGMSHDAARQQWSRCVRAFRTELARDPGPFREWMDDV